MPIIDGKFRVGSSEFFIPAWFFQMSCRREIDNLDFRILSVLIAAIHENYQIQPNNESCNLSSECIANTLSQRENTVEKRIKRLEQRKIIRFNTISDIRHISFVKSITEGMPTNA